MTFRILVIFASFVIIAASAFSPGKAQYQQSGTELIIEVVNGNYAKVVELLDTRADVNTRDKHGWTPLIHAVKHSRFNIVKLLLDRGAEVNAQSVRGITSLSLAAGQGDLGQAKLLLDYGASVEGGEIKVVSAQYLRRQNSLANEVEFLNTPLMRASAVGHKDVVSLLLTHKAYPDAKGFNGSTPLIEAHCYKDVLDLLLESGASINEQDNQGRTALMLAVTNNCYDTVKLLLDKGADVNIKNRTGNTVLDLVRTISNKRIKLLFHRK